MPAKYVGRRLAVIFVADVAGFSQLVGRDEDGTLQRLQHLRNDVVDPIIRIRSGRIIKSLGDGILAEFASVAEAVQAATEIQRAVATRNAYQKPDAWIEFRIGIHNGDVTVQADGDLLGETVNIRRRGSRPWPSQAAFACRKIPIGRFATGWLSLAPISATKS